VLVFREESLDEQCQSSKAYTLFLHRFGLLRVTLAVGIDSVYSIVLFTRQVRKTYRRGEIVVKIRYYRSKATPDLGEY